MNNSTNDKIKIKMKSPHSFALAMLWLLIFVTAINTANISGAQVAFIVGSFILVPSYTYLGVRQLIADIEHRLNPTQPSKAEPNSKHVTSTD